MTISERYPSCRIFSHLETGILIDIPQINVTVCVCEYVDAWDVCGRFEKPLWEEVRKGKGEWGVCSSPQLYWQETGQLSPHIPPTDVWQRKYFHSCRRKGGKIYILRYITVEVVKTEGKKNPHAWFFCMWAYALSSRLIWLVTVSS